MQYSETLEPLPTEATIADDIDVKLEINDINENKKLSQKRKYTKKLVTLEKQFPCQECGKIFRRNTFKRFIQKSNNY